jgi:hypothetical protein
MGLIEQNASRCELQAASLKLQVLSCSLSSLVFNQSFISISVVLMGIPLFFLSFCFYERLVTFFALKQRK